jgi:hypothetical protein
MQLIYLRIRLLCAADSDIEPLGIDNTSFRKFSDFFPILTLIESPIAIF